MKRLISIKRIPRGILSQCNSLDTASAIPSTETNWDLNGGNLAFLEHYKRYIVEWCKKKVPKQKKPEYDSGHLVDTK